MDNMNLLLGYGETLAYDIPTPGGGGPKKHPYTYAEAKSGLISKTDNFLEAISNLPEQAKPRGQAVAKVTLHPAYLAKSYYPQSLLHNFGLVDLGSKSVRVTPRKQTTKVKRENLETSCFYIAGNECSFETLRNSVESDNLNKGLQGDIIKIEEFDYFDPEEKIKSLNEEHVERKIEVALHTPNKDIIIIDSFYEFAKSCGVDVHIDRKISTGGLTFIPVIGDEAAAHALAQFTFLRALRDMPSLRVHTPTIIRSTVSSNAPTLPTVNAINPDLNVAIFDGGIGTSLVDQWCTETVYDTGHRTHPDLLSHGSEVTSTILFGLAHDSLRQLPTPYCNVDHYRVLDTVTGNDPDLFDVLLRITDALDNKDYQYINLSLGPRIPIEDDDVNVWTSTLEKYLSSGQTLATVAVGNDGELMGQNRIQPPADLVNALSVGSANSYSQHWTRAPYSCIGPGRSPGVTKPDGLAFGGSIEEPFTVYSPFSNSIVGTGGTSFASPLVLRNAIAINTLLDGDISPLTSKAIIIHNAEKSSLSKAEAGWGRFSDNPDHMIHCDNNEVTVIYRGELIPSQYVRIPIPFPDIELKGDITLKGTFCFATDVDPEHPINYTKSGLVITFHPKANTKDTRSFFSLKNLYPTEQEHRSDGHKWETTLHHEQCYRKTSLDNPCFDVVYQAREKGQPAELEELSPLPYTLIVTMNIKNTPGVYNAIRQKYQTLAPVELRQNIQIQI
ncbi:S8 family serine peptidase [Alteromonas sp. KUL49]|uniref:S8 family serine peptidase n=1 Tax=Alteromonas sp. KUL49 TaxID=2480798 RepID=UPI00102ED8DC|nr:S8 family serine peptidase [Alteromonas sp. KUL49]TAP42116.1 peptidase S8 [Alteromonas sp. KUL49]GEA09698.1 hypothetical protein KUL49_00730 [Alteromonas sp. KUL49]